MPQELTNSFGKVFLTIYKDERNRWIHVNWMGYLTADNIKAGAAAYTAALANAGFDCVLNDTRLIIGSWNHSLDWALQEWSPNAAKAGLKHLAMVTTPETFAGSTAAAFYANLEAFQAQVFDDMDNAKQWLRQYSLNR
ncbi:STAS/SEC14 domain-containing protein [Pontibacter sp. 172403-2]|uniref:STAS/SEC14 domain-containing protein n=1 Tax=Pontibacter rufus TaxID=2791028 RepID=UPI0018AFFD62|nr:STAS/SEC14 domain-containing protein [Pontibacter sp. 172403-2]MBF9254566.1 STAS/SEC14 domain-containing protein [Pontibacter sp. 172403-2]